MKKIGVLHDPSPYANAQKAAAEKEAKDFGLEVVGIEQYKTDDADLSVAIQKMYAAGARAILKIGLGGTTLTAAKNIKQLGLDMLMLTSLEDIAVFRPVAEVLGDKFFFVASPAQVYDALPDGALKTEIGKFLTPWRAKHGDRDPNWAGRGWDAVMLTAAAVEKAKSFDGREAARHAGDDGRLPGHDRRLSLLADQPSGHHGEPAAARHGSSTARSKSRSDERRTPQVRVLEVEALSARYGHVEALRPVDLFVGEGELVAVLGPNGAGKSTLMRAADGTGRHAGRGALSRHARAAPQSGRCRRDGARAGAGRARHFRTDERRGESRARRLSAQRQGGVRAPARARAVALPAPEGTADARSPARSPAASSRCSRSAAR